MAQFPVSTTRCPLNVGSAMEITMSTTKKDALQNGMRPIHPGEILLEEFLEPLGISAGKLAEAIHVTPARIYEIISGRRGITANTALRLSKALGTTPQLWLNLQMSYDIRMQEIAVGNDIEEEVHLLPELEEAIA